VVVDDGETFAAIPLLTAIFPGVMTPVPLEKMPVRLVDPPSVIELGSAVKLVIEGFATFTVTVAVWAAVTPAVFVTVSV
jgi:hypothetical protein